MVKHRWKKIISLLCVSCMLLTGCGQKEKETDGSGGSDQAMGRFVEQSLELENGFGHVGSFLRLADGRLAVLSLGEGAFVSSDEGNTWQGWLTAEWESEVLYNGYNGIGAIAPDGSVFIQYTSYEEPGDAADGTGGQDTGEDGGANGQKTENSEEGSGNAAGTAGAAEVDPEDTGNAAGDAQWEESDLIENTYHVFLFPDGTTARFPVTENDFYLSSCAFSPDGKLYAGNGENIYEVNPQDGSFRQLFATAGAESFLKFAGQKLLVFGAWGMQVYDLEKKELDETDEVMNGFIQKIAQGSRTLVYSGGKSILMVDVDEDGTIYLACSDGIYRHSIGGGTIEMLADGSLTTLGNVSASKYGMLAKDNEFMILYENMLASYVFDPEVPAVPEKTLKVYGLEKDDSVRQAINLFQKDHQDVYVEYEEGLVENSGQTAEDAVKTLNTQILAGKGPDVILLDGLPVASYMEKGMLQDLTALADSLKEQCFDNLLGSFQIDGKVYAVPVKVQLPLMVGDKEMLSGVSDLKGLADYVEKMRELYPEGTVTQTYMPEETLRVLAITSAPAWTDSSGNIQEDKVREFLQMALEIYETEKQGVTEQDIKEFEETNVGSSSRNMDNFYLNTAVNALNSYVNEGAMALGQVGAFQFGFTNVISAVRGRADLWWGPMAGQTGQVYTPTLIAGISSKAAEPELAYEFIRVLLSRQNQDQLYDDFPVNRESLENLLTIPQGSDGEMGNMTLVRDDGTFVNMTCYYPNEEENSRLKELLGLACTPYMAGGIVEEAVIASGIRVLNGEMDVETGLSQIMETVALYLSE